MAKATESATEKPVKSGKPAKAVSADKPGIFARLGNYFRDVRAEMTRVVWPSRPEVVNSSVVVVVTLLFFITFILIMDYIIVLPLIKAISSIRIGG
jgi:preprotein translocase subunit SecE